MNNFTKALLAGSALVAVFACTNVSNAQPVNPPAGGGGACSVFGTTAGTCAEGNDSRITGALQTSSLASGMNTFLTTPSSANLRATLSDESGTGAAIFAGGNIGAGSATTATLSDNSTLIATTAFVKGQAYATLAAPTFTGSVNAPTPTLSDNSTLVATTAFVKGQSYAPLASPTFTGNPVSTTPAFNDNSTRIATTAFVIGQGYASAGSGGVFTSNQSPTATEFNVNCKTLTMNAASLSVAIPKASTLQANGGCYIIKAVANNVSLTIDPADKLNNGTTGVGGTLLAGNNSVITTDGVNGIFAELGSAGGGGGFPITIGSTSIASGSTTTSISGLTLVGPALGTPISGVGTNLTGIPISTGISGLGTNVATFLATPSASNLNGMLTGDSVDLLGAVQTITGQKTFSNNGAASAPGVVVSGTVFAGTNANSYPLFYISPASGATQPTTAFNTGGAMFGILTPTGFGGDAISIFNSSNTKIFSIGNNGSMTSGNNITAPVTSSILFSSRGGIKANGDGQLAVRTNGDSITGTNLALGYMRFNAVTFASLPGSPAAGWRAFVSDQTAACAFGTTANGGGSNTCPVWYNGTAWIDG